MGVLITTKKGKSGAPKFQFDAYTGVSQTNRLPKLLNAQEFLMIRNEAITNANALAGSQPDQHLRSRAMLDTLADTNWLDLMFSTPLPCSGMRFRPAAAANTAPIL